MLMNFAKVSYGRKVDPEIDKKACGDPDIEFYQKHLKIAKVLIKQIETLKQKESETETETETDEGPVLKFAENEPGLIQNNQKGKYNFSGLNSELDKFFERFKQINADFEHSIPDLINVRNTSNIHIGNKANLKIHLHSSWDELVDILSLFYPRICFVVPRNVWKPLPIKEQYEHMEKPVKYVVISHTAAESAHTVKKNLHLVKYAQKFHVLSRGWNDIGYNFLIGCDGNVYEGRGWGIVGAHTKGFNQTAIGISFMGCFLKENPTPQAFEALNKLLYTGVLLGELHPDYRLICHSQVSCTQSPGSRVVEEIVTWDHFYKFSKTQDLMPTTKL